MTLTTTIYNESGFAFIVTFFYTIEDNVVTIETPLFIHSPFFGDGWQDDLVKALHEELDFDFELKII